MHQPRMKRLHAACNLYCPPGLLITILALIPLCSAAEVNVEASVNSHNISEDETVMLSITVKMGAGDNAEEPVLSDTDEFAIIGTPRREQGYNIINMQMSKYSRRVYRLKPLRTGELTVPSASVTVNGTTHRTRPIRVNVTHRQPPAPKQRPQRSRQQKRRHPPSRQPSGEQTERGESPFEGHPPLAIKSTIDKDSVYVNEQVTLETHYYSRHRLSHRPGMEAPEAQGFVTEDLPDPDPEYTIINYRRYIDYISLWALFPTRPGSYTVSVGDEKLSFPPMYQQRKFSGNEVTVHVKPLPDPPAGIDFSDAVGKLTAQISANKSEIKAGEGATVELTVDNTGNPRTVEPPELNVPDWCRVYKSAESRSIQPRSRNDRQVIGGQITFEYLIVPRKQGTINVGPVTLAYFDPQTGKYGETTTAQITINVAGGEVISGAAEGPAGGSLRYIHTRSPRLFAHHRLVNGPLPAIVGLVCLLSLLAAAAVRYRRNYLNAHPDKTRASHAARVARRKIGSLKNSPDGQELSQSIADDIRQYIADRFGIAAFATPANEISDSLRRCDVDAEAADEVFDFLCAIDGRRFAPTAEQSASADDMLQTAEQLIEKLEGQARP